MEHWSPDIPVCFRISHGHFCCGEHHRNPRRWHIPHQNVRWSLDRATTLNLSLSGQLSCMSALRQSEQHCPSIRRQKVKELSLKHHRKTAMEYFSYGHRIPTFVHESVDWEHRRIVQYVWSSMVSFPSYTNELRLDGNSGQSRLAQQSAKRRKYWTSSERRLTRLSVSLEEILPSERHCLHESIRSDSLEA